MTEAERPGAEARHVASGLERIGRDLRAVENLQPVADRIGKHDQVCYQPLFGERARAALKLDARCLELGRERLERGGVRDLPAEHLDAFAAVGIDDDALLAVVHAKRHGRARLVDPLEAEQARAIARPVA